MLHNNIIRLWSNLELRANTALEEMSRPFPNAFSMVTPLILDSSVIEKADGNITHLKPWGLSTEGDNAYA